MAKSLSPKVTLWTPQRGSQMAFHQDDDTFELLLGGAAGGGKSQSLLVEAMKYAPVPGYRAILFRRTFPELEKSLVPVAYEFLHGHAKPKNKGMEWQFKNGSVIYLSHMQREEDKEKHKSAEYDYAGFDELTSFLESQYIYIFSRIRGKNPAIKRRVRSATNPTGIGAAWVKGRFVDVDDKEATPYEEIEYEYANGWTFDGKTFTDFSNLPENFQLGDPAFSNEIYTTYKDRKSGLTRAFIPALLWGNEKLIKNDPDYIRRLRALPEKQQQALLYGRWDAFEGQFFAEWDESLHVEEVSSIPPHWKRFVGIDYGFGAPFCALWAAVDEQANVHVYRELYGARQSPTEQSNQILNFSKDEKIEWFTADPAMFSQHGHGESFAQIYDRAGVSLIPSNNSRVAGWAIIHDMLMGGKLKVQRSCTNLIRMFPMLNHSKQRPEDIDTKQEDHAHDALRYLLLTLRGFASQQRRTYDPDRPPEPEWWGKVQANRKKQNFMGRYRV